MRVPRPFTSDIEEPIESYEMKLWKQIRQRLLVFAAAHLLLCINLFVDVFELSERGRATNLFILFIWPIAFIIETSIFVRRAEKSEK